MSLEPSTEFREISRVAQNDEKHSDRQPTRSWVHASCWSAPPARSLAHSLTEYVSPPAIHHHNERANCVHRFEWRIGAPPPTPLSLSPSPLMLFPAYVLSALNAQLSSSERLKTKHEKSFEIERRETIQRRREEKLKTTLTQSQDGIDIAGPCGENRRT